MANDKLDWLRRMREQRVVAPKEVLKPKEVVKEPQIWPSGSTYRYRDPEKRRAYMRELMQKRRGPK